MYSLGDVVDGVVLNTVAASRELYRIKDIVTQYSGNKPLYYKDKDMYVVLFNAGLTNPK